MVGLCNILVSLMPNICSCFISCHQPSSPSWAQGAALALFAISKIYFHFKLPSPASLTPCYQYSTSLKLCLGPGCRHSECTPSAGVLAFCHSTFHCSSLPCRVNCISILLLQQSLEKYFTELCNLHYLLGSRTEGRSYHWLS